MRRSEAPRMNASGPPFSLPYHEVVRMQINHYRIARGDAEEVTNPTKLERTDIKLPSPDRDSVEPQRENPANERRRGILRARVKILRPSYGYDR